jgi:pimeloyl-ACP methyl ester carboxylesterase
LAPTSLVAEKSLASFVLVPGAWHGAWCFAELATMLRSADHDVRTPDLPGVGRDASPSAITLDGWAEAIAAVVIDCDKPPILLGHSRGGIVISQVAELVPDDLVETVYLAAALLPNGTVPLDGLIARMPKDQQGIRLPEFLEPPPFEVVHATAFSGCDRTVALAAYSKLVPEPVAPLSSPLKLTLERFGSVPRTYIETLRDHAVLLEDQRSMQALLPCARVLQLESDHSPFLSSCRDLRDTLLGIAADPLRRVSAT